MCHLLLLGPHFSHCDFLDALPLGVLPSKLSQAFQFLAFLLLNQILVIIVIIVDNSV